MSMKRKLIVLSICSFMGLCANILTAQTSNNLNFVCAESDYTIVSGEWNETIENGERVLTNLGGGEINYGGETTDNAFEVQIRHNTLLIDRNINLNVKVGSTTYTLDMRMDSNKEAHCARYRVNNGFDAYDFQVDYQASEWIKFKIVFLEGKVLCFIDDFLAYEKECSVNPTESKQMSLSSWEVPASFKNAKTFIEALPEETSSLPFDSFDGTKIIEGRYFNKLSSGVRHAYTGPSTTEIECDFYVRDWTGDRNFGLFYTYDGVEYFIRFDGTGTYIKNDSTGENYATSNVVVSINKVHCLKLVFSKTQSEVFVDGVNVFSWKTNFTSEVSNVSIWDWNLEAYLAKHNHKYTHHDKVDAKCSVVGMDEHYSCICGKLFDINKNEKTADELKIAASGNHIIDSSRWEKNEKGHYHPCTVCGGYDEIFPHEGKWVKVLEPTRDEYGKEELDCTVCGYHEERNIDKLPEKYEFNNNQFVRTSEDGEDVYSSIKENVGGSGEIVIANNSVGNTIKAQIRANETAIDRNVALHIVSSTHDYMFDYRQDLNVFRVRIDGGFNAYDYTKEIPLNTWFEMKVTVVDGAMKCYVNGELSYDYKDESIVLDQTNKFVVSAWDCNISMKNPEVFTQENTLQNLKLESQPTKTTYLYGEELDLTGLLVKKVFLFGNETEVDNSQLIISNYDSHALGEQTVRLSLDDKFVEFKVLVLDRTEELIISSPISKTEYKYGEELDLTGLVIKARMASGTIEEVSPIDYEISAFNKNKLGEQTLIVSYQEKTVSFSVTVIDYATEISLLSQPTKTEYEVGDTLDLTGTKMEVTMASGAKQTIDVTNEMINGFDSTTVGKKVVTITYDGFVITFEVNVNEKNIVEETTNNGCGGSIATASSSIALISLIGAAFIISNKKKK